MISTRFLEASLAVLKDAFIPLKFLYYGAAHHIDNLGIQKKLHPQMLLSLLSEKWFLIEMWLTAMIRLRLYILHIYKYCSEYTISLGTLHLLTLEPADTETNGVW